MPDNIYTLLVIECQPTEKSNIYRVCARWEDTLAKSVQIIDEYDLVWNLSPLERVLFSRMAEGLSTSELQQIGERLFNAVFPLGGSIRNTYDKLLNAAHSITLILRFFAPELSQYPWEAMFDGQRYVIERGLPLVRSIRPFAIQNPQPVQRLSIFYASAAPQDLDYLRITEKLYIDIETALKKQHKRGRGIDLAPPLYKANRTQLGKHIAELKPHAVCLVMHGTNDRLMLHHEREDGSDPLTVGDLLKMLHKTPVRVVILVACRTAAYSPSNGLSDFAHMLVTEPSTGISAVVAMQTPIEQLRASEFAERLFFHLGQFDSIEASVSRARHVLSQRDRTNRDTFSPVLYMQTRSGVLFRKQVNWPLRITLSLAALFAFLFFVSVIFSVVNDLRRQFETDRLVSISNEQRLQTIAQLSRVSTVANTHSISSPLDLIYLDDTVWAFEQNGSIHRFSVNKNDEVFVGAEPLAPIELRDYLWIVSRREGTLTKVNPADISILSQISLASGLEAPFEAGGAVWVQSFVETSLFRIDPMTDEVSRFFTGFDIHHAFAGDEYVWILPRRGNRIQRIHATTLESERISIDINIIDGIYLGESIWVLSEDSTLIQFNPITLEPLTTLAMPKSVQGLRAEGLFIWVISTDQRSIYSVNPLTSEIVHIYEFDTAVSDFLFTEARLWFLTSENTLITYDTQQNEPVFEQTLIGMVRLWRAFSDGEMLWLPVENELYILRETDGSEYRRLAMCQDFSKPLYDGVNVWFYCPRNGEVRHLPVRMQYFGVERFNRDIYTNIPIEHSGALWFTQEDSGRILALIEGIPPLEVAMGTPLTPLKTDGEFLWTTAPSEGQLLRLHPQIEPPSFLRPYSTLSVEVDEIRLVGEIHSFHLIEGQIWILHTRPDQLGEAANLSIVNRSTLEIQQHRLAIIPAGLTYEANKVWVSASGLDDGFIYVFNPRTGELIDTLNLPDTNYASWAPVHIDNSLYFTAGAPPLDEAGRFIINLFLNNQQTLDLQPLLYEYNLDENTWKRILDIVPAPYAPLNADPFLWFLSGYLPNAQEPNAGLLFALNPRTEETVGPLSICQNMTMPRANDRFVWVGCQLPDMDLWVFDRQTGQQVATYENIGSDPWAPVAHDGYTWITFRESNTAAVFNADTAALINIFSLGRSPGPPFIYQNDVWVINSGEGSMQRLRMEVSK